MPSFGFLDSLENLLETGKFPADASKSVKKSLRAASKRFIYKDGSLWRRYRGRLLRVVRSEQEVREVLTRYHNGNNHAGRERVVREIKLMYYWVGVSETVKNWVKSCSVCQERPPPHQNQPTVLLCLVYGCDASSYSFPELTFHRFPKDGELRKRWLEVAQRDEGSLRPSSYICSRHFDPSCFTLTEDGRLTLSPDSVPTVLPAMVQGIEATDPSNEDFLQSSAWNDALTRAVAVAASGAAGHGDQTCTLSEPSEGLQEHQYCIPGPAPDSRATHMLNVNRMTYVQTNFVTYNHIARYLGTRVLPLQGKKCRNALKRMAKRFDLIDGVLMYTRVSPPLRVPRSREEVNSILQQFHDNQGHYGQGICQREIAKHFYWGSLSRDLAGWISSCQTCVNRTKRKMIRCSVNKCSNRCGPVERKLGLTFHKFPLYNLPVLAHWMKAVGRVHWHPSLWSSICSSHFTEDCFERGGDKTTLRPDAVPTLNIHGDSSTPAGGPAQQPLAEEAFFAKYDAVELYLSRRTYPPGLTYVEKNTFRRFCKKYAFIDDRLHFMSGDRVRLVLRNRQQVEAALVDFHDELNHLNVNKCLRLLNERYFWKTMKFDVMEWINSCSQCSLTMGKKAHGAEVERSKMLTLQSPDSDSAKDEDSEDACGDEDYEEDDDDDGGACVIEEQQVIESVEEMEAPPPSGSQPRIPILIHLRTPNNLQPQTPNQPLIPRFWSVNMETPDPSENPSEGQPGNQTTEPEEQRGTGTRTQHFIQSQDAATPLTEPTQHPPRSQNSKRKTKKSSEPPAQRSDRPPAKRRRTAEPEPSAAGLDPVVAPSTKPWPVFTIAHSALGQAAQPTHNEDSSPLGFHKSTKLQARVVVQQCSHAKVKVKPAVDGADPEWVQIQQGIVVYVCFFHGASEAVTFDIARKLMSTKFFRRDRHVVSVLDLPGSVLLVPQDSLVMQPLPNRRMAYRGGCEVWLGAQLFSRLVSVCRELLAGSPKSAQAGTTVEYGVYGQKQEIVLNSPEPLTLLLDF